MSTRTRDLTDADWWRTAVVYQVYPRSFADGNGDGIGDLAGLIDRVPYLARLGIDAVWLSPFYPSALADGGYDVDDYRDVDPRIGTLAQFDELVAALHAEGIRIVVDIVPNHSGSGHAWFQAALAAAPGSPERARYVFRDGLGEHGELPPSDWVSHFGGSAWTRVPDPSSGSGRGGQWYLHLFAPEQPDFDWSNPEVREEFHGILRFWADRGVDGFRVDVAHALAKDLTEPLPSYPRIARDVLKDDGTDVLFDRDEVHEIFRGWRKVMDEYDPPRSAVAEAWAAPSRLPLYARPDELGQTFEFDLVLEPWDAAAFRRSIEVALERARAAGASSTWVLSNHDIVRHASRFGLPAGTDLNAWLLSQGTSPVEDRERGAARALAGSLLLLALPGSAYLYQGEELALPEVADLQPEALEDPIWERTGHVEKGRDGARVPLPWTADGPSFGFGAGGAHLPQPAWFGRYAVAVEDADPASVLNRYREALAVRAGLLAGEGVRFVDGREGVIEFERDGGWRCITAFGAPAELPPGEVLLSSAPIGAGRVLPADATAWLRDPA
ncbi:glycoside hydrolase family 13 protein [Amnibacterium setariae]|uniref:Alpha-amylase n=1 Tax=Amnibacterium setariae TaxID=2306585 RepID=A0A3A1TZL2_9MICO|nr:glycoside hydrolase family 13 protein [Amnibacterium setariae]RIX26460.1 alpha-amylase [Amnibacterium setariae]